MLNASALLLSVLFFLSLYLGGRWAHLIVGLKAQVTRWQWYSLGCLAGINLYYLLHLLGENLFFVTTIKVLAIGLIFSAILYAKRYFSNINWQFAPTATSAKLLLCLIPLILATLLVPISEWDARSIWFFHGKILYYSEGLFSADVWGNSFYGFSHPHYPKLFPVLIGATADFSGLWNEFFPKITVGLFAFLVGIYTLSMNFNLPLSLVVLLTCLGIPEAYSWNGYVDAYVSAFSFLGLLALAQFIHKRKEIFLFLAVSSFGLVLNLKNEGLALCFGIMLTFILAHYKIMLENKKSVLKSLLVVLPALGAFVAWSITKNKLGISGYFQFNSSMIDAIGLRLADGTSLIFILKKVGGRVLPGIALFVISAIFLKGQFKIKKSLSNYWLLALWLYYLLVIFIIYLGTPLDLNWHVNHSVTRVTFVLNTIMIAFCIERFFIQKSFIKGS